MTHINLDSKMRPYEAYNQTECCILTCPLVIMKKGFEEKNITTTDKVCFIACTSAVFGAGGAAVGGVFTGGTGILPGFAIGAAVGATVASVKVAIDEFC